MPTQKQAALLNDRSLGERSSDAPGPPQLPVWNSPPDRLSRYPYTSTEKLRVSPRKIPRRAHPRPPLYSPQERLRRDASPWTKVQAVLAPVQFLIFILSLALVLRYLATGNGLTAATTSIVIKTLALYTIMITGSIWEHAVFGRYLFARAFFWEDVFSILVLALHTAYLVVLVTGWIGPVGQMTLALVAYVTYLINATQFLLKLRAARIDLRADDDPCSELVGAVP
jgi:3-vinyl bacteriochlorophyllide hydratase